MALTQLTVKSARPLGLSWLSATEANVAGADYSSSTTLPTGFGDCMLLECGLVVTGAGAAIDPANKGILMWLDDATALVRDVLGVGQLYVITASIDAAWIKPDMARFWRADERLNISFPDLETATNTGDVEVFALVRQLSATAT